MCGIPTPTLISFVVFHMTYERTFFALRRRGALLCLPHSLSPDVDAFGKGVNGRTTDE